MEIPAAGIRAILQRRGVLGTRGAESVSPSRCVRCRGPWVTSTCWRSRWDPWSAGAGWSVSGVARGPAGRVEPGGVGGVGSALAGHQHVHWPRWMTWCRPHISTPLERSVGPPSARCRRWCASHHAAHRSQPGKGAPVAVARGECAALGGGEQPSGAAHIQRDGVAVEHGRDDAGGAGPPAGRRGGVGDPVGPARGSPGHQQAAGAITRRAPLVMTPPGW